jgi:hypothetical protein
MLICADHATFEDREETLKSICVDRAAILTSADIFFVVIDRFVFLNGAGVPLEA